MVVASRHGPPWPGGPFTPLEGVLVRYMSDGRSLALALHIQVYRLVPLFGEGPYASPPTPRDTCTCGAPQAVSPRRAAGSRPERGAVQVSSPVGLSAVWPRLAVMLYAEPHGGAAQRGMEPSRGWGPLAPSPRDQLPPPADFPAFAICIQSRGRPSQAPSRGRGEGVRMTTEDHAKGPRWRFARIRMQSRAVAYTWVRAALSHLHADDGRRGRRPRRRPTSQLPRAMRAA